MNGNVFAFSFSAEGFEAIVNLTEIDQTYVMAKIADEKLPQSVNSIISQMELRAKFNQERKMEVWLVKLSHDFDEKGLLEMARDDPQAVADIARMGANIIGKRAKERDVIV
jgi:hypothetical protein